MMFYTVIQMASGSLIHSNHFYLGNFPIFKISTLTYQKEELDI